MNILGEKMGSAVGGRVREPLVREGGLGLFFRFGGGGFFEVFIVEGLVLLVPLGVDFGFFGFLFEGFLGGT